MKKISTVFCLMMGFTFSALSYGDIFTNADSSFSARDQGFAKATEAREQYAAMLGNLSGSDLIYAVSQMSRLDLYRANMIEGIDLEVKRDVLDACIDNTEMIESTDSQEYYYFYTACIGSRGKLSGSVGRLKYGMMLRKVQDDALASTKLDGEFIGGFEAGGILRVFAAVRGNRKAKPLGLYEPTEALQFAKLALAAEPAIYRPFPNPLSGKDFFENSHYVGQAEIAIGIENNDKRAVLQGKLTLENTMTLIEELEAFDDLPEGREPETLYYKNLMIELNGFVDACIELDSWNECLSQKLN